ncbi:MAG TPA: penicillin-binding transpeptidase domain-containing protein, partial [Ktedonobacteraceae bacterium]|nr:penicillin-binding transpeptidase domain-containing protein [Ktedonobacteraceae bacterium]
MKPEKEQITPENVEEQIQHALHMSGAPNPSASAEERVIRELYHMYNGEEAIMARAWQRLVERHPEVVDPIDSFDTRPQKVIPLLPLPQSRPPRNSWRQRAMILVMVAICLLVIGASAFVYYQKLAAPVPKRNVVPIQGFHLVDSKGRVLYQTDGQKTQDFSQDQHTADFVQYALAQLASDLHVKPEALLKMNIRVVTTLDLDVQSKAYQSAQQQIQNIKSTKNVSDSAVVVLDYRTGAIRALFGSLNPQGGAYNVATGSGRQMGSAFKPFVYAVAFDHGVSPGDVVNDVKTSFPPGNYTPQNYDGQFHGPMSYRTALQNDYNIPAIKLLEQMHIAPTVQNIAALGVP